MRRTSRPPLRSVIGDYRQHYNHRRAHSSLDDGTPAAFASACRWETPRRLAAIRPPTARGCWCWGYHPFLSSEVLQESQGGQDAGEADGDVDGDSDSDSDDIITFFEYGDAGC